MGPEEEATIAGHVERGQGPVGHHLRPDLLELGPPPSHRLGVDIGDEALIQPVAPVEHGGRSDGGGVEAFGAQDLGQGPQIGGHAKHQIQPHRVARRVEASQHAGV